MVLVELANGPFSLKLESRLLLISYIYRAYVFRRLTGILADQDPPSTKGDLCTTKGLTTIHLLRLRGEGNQPPETKSSRYDIPTNKDLPSTEGDLYRDPLNTKGDLCITEGSTLVHSVGLGGEGNQP